MKYIDYLPQDPFQLINCKFFLISIIGPEYRQKNDVYAVKIRGYANNEKEVERKIKALKNIDTTCDIYVVEAGVFFPLAVDPLAIQDVRYQEKALEELMKNYTENRILANESFNIRKNEMMNEAVKENLEYSQSQELLKNEHPMSILKRKTDLEEQIQNLKDTLEDKQNYLEKTLEKYNSLPQEEKEKAELEFIDAVNKYTTEKTEKEKFEIQEDESFNLKEMKEYFMNLDKKTEKEDDFKEIEDILVKLNEVNDKLKNLPNDDNERINLEYEKSKLKKALGKQDFNKINEFITQNGQWKVSFDNL